MQATLAIQFTIGGLAGGIVAAVTGKNIAKGAIFGAVTGLAETYIGLASDCAATGGAPDAITIGVTFVASIGVALGFRNSQFADDFARQLDGAVKEVIEAASRSVIPRSLDMSYRLRGLANARMLSIEEVLAVSGPFGVEIVARASQQAFGPKTFAALAGVINIGTELIKKFLSLTPTFVDGASK